MYAVVTLQDSNEVVVVASNWLSTDKKQCHWPPFKSPEKCMDTVQNRHAPETGGKPWEKLNISFHKEYATFDWAKEGQKEMKETKKQEERLHRLGSGILKRQRLESTLGMLKNQLHPLPSVPPASTSRNNDKEELLQMLKDIKRTVQENSTMLRELLKDNTVCEAPSSTSAISKDIKPKLNLPLRNLDDVATIERELKTAASRNKYVKYLSRLGGFGPKDVIKNIMQQVLTDDLAKEFNWQGRGDKRPFSQLNLTDVIREAASKQHVIRVDCDTQIKKYLSYTADRISRKRPREQGAVLGPEMPSEISILIDNQPEVDESWNLDHHSWVM